MNPTRTFFSAPAAALSVAADSARLNVSPAAAPIAIFNASRLLRSVISTSLKDGSEVINPNRARINDSGVKWSQSIERFLVSLPICVG
jgi:hypothetical protein